MKSTKSISGDFFDPVLCGRWKTVSSASEKHRENGVSHFIGKSCDGHRKSILRPPPYGGGGQDAFVLF